MTKPTRSTDPISYSKTEFLIIKILNHLFFYSSFISAIMWCKSPNLNMFGVFVVCMGYNLMIERTRDHHNF